MESVVAAPAGSAGGASSSGSGDGGGGGLPAAAASRRAHVAIDVADGGAAADADALGDGSDDHHRGNYNPTRRPRGFGFAAMTGEYRYLLGLAVVMLLLYTEPAYVFWLVEAFVLYRCIMAIMFLAAALRRGATVPGAPVTRRSAFAASAMNATNLRLSMVDRDFNERDYEALLALDADNISRGAPQEQIDLLPLHEVQEPLPEGSATCCICLETIETGSLVRTLPCLHMFHTHCVDEWLRRNSTCPVCKSKPFG